MSARISRSRFDEAVGYLVPRRRRKSRPMTTTSDPGKLTGDNWYFARGMTNGPTLFAQALHAWYGSDWRRVAPPALGRSRRTIARWAADDGRVPRWAWQRFSTDRVAPKWYAIDRRAAQDRNRIDELANQHKSAVNIAARLVDDRLRLTEFELPPRVGRPPKVVNS
jgi:hypothetical protein